VTKRVLLDESVPRQLAVPLDAAEFLTAPYPNEWKQTKNGELPMPAEKNAFDVLITSDKNIYAQQNLRGRKLVVVVLPTNRRRDIMERASDIVDTVDKIMPGQYVVIEMMGQRPIINHGAGESAGDEMPAIAPFKTK
jgi:hypothetical protein